MASVVKLVKTLRNNWKKTVFFGALSVYGIQYGRQKYTDSCWRRVYCLEAQKYGQEPVKPGERLRKLSVFLNPAASGGQGKALFEKNAAPLLHLAGIEVTVIKTEYEGQAKKYMDILDRKDVDAILVVGGDGTLSEVVTGLLRRADHHVMSKIPIGVIPVGKTNTLARTLFYRGDSDVRWMLEAAMAIIRGNTKPLDIMRIEGEGDKTVYAVAGLEWGAFRDAENKKKKYWYFGMLKDRWAYLRSVLGEWPQVNSATVSYILPCEGCSKCFVAPVIPQWKWWHLFLPPKVEVPKKDYSQVVNEECGLQHVTAIKSLQFDSKTQLNKDSPEEGRCIEISLAPEIMSRKEFIGEGWRRNKGAKTGDLYHQIRVSEFTLVPELEEGEESWYTIDNELFEVMPLHVKLLRSKLRVFCADAASPFLTALDAKDSSAGFAS